MAILPHVARLSEELTHILECGTDVYLDDEGYANVDDLIPLLTPIKRQFCSDKSVSRTDIVDLAEQFRLYDVPWFEMWAEPQVGNARDAEPLYVRLLPAEHFRLPEHLKHLSKALTSVLRYSDAKKTAYFQDEYMDIDSAMALMTDAMVKRKPTKTDILNVIRLSRRDRDGITILRFALHPENSHFVKATKNNLSSTTNSDAGRAPQMAAFETGKRERRIPDQHFKQNDEWHSHQQQLQLYHPREQPQAQAGVRGSGKSGGKALMDGSYATGKTGGGKQHLDTASQNDNGKNNSRAPTNGKGDGAKQGKDISEQHRKGGNSGKAPMGASDLIGKKNSGKSLADLPEQNSKGKNSNKAPVDASGHRCKPSGTKLQEDGAVQKGNNRKSLTNTSLPIGKEGGGKPHRSLSERSGKETGAPQEDVSEQRSKGSGAGAIPIYAPQQTNAVVDDLWGSEDMSCLYISPGGAELSEQVNDSAPQPLAQGGIGADVRDNQPSERAMGNNTSVQPMEDDAANSTKHWTEENHAEHLAGRGTTTVAAPCQEGHSLSSNKQPMTQDSEWKWDGQSNAYVRLDLSNRWVCCNNPADENQEQWWFDQALSTWAPLPRTSRGNAQVAGV